MVSTLSYSVVENLLSIYHKLETQRCLKRLINFPSLFMIVAEISSMFTAIQ